MHLGKVSDQNKGDVTISTYDVTNFSKYKELEKDEP